MTDHKLVTHEEWVAARAELLKREKEVTRMGDEVARLRRELPWVRVEKEYTFGTADGPKTLAELFDGRSQLVFGPDWEAGCPVCSSIADSFDGVVAPFPTAAARRRLQARPIRRPPAQPPRRVDPQRRQDRPAAGIP